MGFGHPLEVLGPVVVMEPLTRLGTQGLDVSSCPLGPITDDAQAYLLSRNHASLFALLEGLAELLLIVHLMPTAPMDDALAINQIEAKALGVPPLAPPPRPFGPRASLAPSGAPGRCRDASAHRLHRCPTPSPEGAIDQLTQRRGAARLSSRDGATSNTVGPVGHLVSHGVHPCAPKRHARQIVQERLGRVIRDFSDQICRGLVHIELFASRHQTQGVVEGVETRATSASGRST